MQAAKFEILAFDAPDVIATSGEGGSKKTYKYLTAFDGDALWDDWMTLVFDKNRVDFPAISAVIDTGYGEQYTSGEYALVDSVAIPDDGNDYIAVWVNGDGAPTSLSDVYAWLEQATNGFIEVQ